MGHRPTIYSRVFGGVFAAFLFLLLVGCAGVSSGSQSSPPSKQPSGGNPTGQLAVSPATLSFGNIVLGSNSSLKGTLTASGSDVTVSSAAWNGAGYSVTGITFPTTVSAGSNVTYTVTFAPQAAGSSPGSISFTSDASNSPSTQSFTGTGTQVAPSAHTVSLSWTASTSSVIGYNIYRGTQSGGPYAKLNSSPQPGTAYTDNAVASGTTYYYVATSVDASSSESSYSNQAVAQVPNP